MSPDEIERQVLPYRAPAEPDRAAGWEMVVWYVLLGLYGGFALAAVAALLVLVYVGIGD